MMILRTILTTLLPKSTLLAQKCSASTMKVTLCGAATQIGQPLGLLLKQSPFVDELALYDTQEISGLAMELGLLDTKCSVKAYSSNNAQDAFANSQVVVIVSGLNLIGKEALEKGFAKNACVVQETVRNMIKFCPKALVAIGTNPIESLVPVASETLKLADCYEPSRVFGITTLNVVRANTFAANTLGLQPECVLVPVLGGNVEDSVVPVLSQALPCSEFSTTEVEHITTNLQRVQCGPTCPASAPILAQAFSMARFVVSLVKGLSGFAHVLEYSFIRTNDCPAVKYFGVPIFLGKNGVSRDLGIPKLSCYESCLLDHAVPHIEKWIEKGNRFTEKEDPCDPCKVAAEKECDPCEPKI